LEFSPNFLIPESFGLGATGNFKELHENIESLLEPFKFEKNDRKFTAHATLARVKFLKKDQKNAFIKYSRRIKGYRTWYYVGKYKYF